jgi:hypothetical protein
MGDDETTEPEPTEGEPTEGEGNGEGQPSTDPSVYHEGVDPGAVGEATEEPRPAPGPPDIYGTGDAEEGEEAEDGESEDGGEETPAEEPAAP